MTTFMGESLELSADLSNKIASQLSGWTGDDRARRAMAPDLSYGRQSGPPGLNARSGAVAMLLYDDGGEWRMPLTVRPTAIRRHGGQICLPGGLSEPGEDPQSTAARELFEELGIAENIEWLGCLPEFYVYVSNIRVTPWIARATAPPVWTPDPREVDSVIEFPLSALVESTCIGEKSVRYGPMTLNAPCYEFDGAQVWGATAMMLSEFASLLRAVHA